MDYDPLNPEAAAEERKARSKTDKIKRDAELADVLFLMKTAQGRRVVHRLLTKAGVYRSSFTPGDPHGTSFNEGMRTLGLWLTSEIMEIAAPSYYKMLEEAKDAH